MRFYLLFQKNKYLPSAFLHQTSYGAHYNNRDAPNMVPFIVCIIVYQNTVHKLFLCVIMNKKSKGA